MGNLVELRKELKGIAETKRAEVSQGFFKTGKGEYGEGDVFLGITVPQSRKIAIMFKDLPFSEILGLLKSKIHEERLIALLILVYNFNAGNEKAQKKIFDFYLENMQCVNNWDLVDLSADKIVGVYLLNSSSESELPRSNFSILIKLARSENLWERRIAIVATYYFIKNNKFNATLKIARVLLKDEHDLIHKAVGWMLREVGKRDMKTEIKFLNKHYKKMPRTMLRYSIERFPEELRMDYLKNNV